MLRLFACLAIGCLSLLAGDLKNQMEVNAFGGGIHFQSAGNKGLAGGSVGYGITSKAQIFGEYSYTKLRGGSSTHLFTGGLKYNFWNTDRVDLYGLAGFGLSRSTTAIGNPILDPQAGQIVIGPTSSNDPTLHLGGGARIYVGKRWGFTPEVRYMRIFFRLERPE